jgi:transporter family protein
MTKLTNKAFLPALAAMVLWGISCWLPKLAMQGMEPHSVIFYEALGNLIVVVPVLFFLKGKLEGGRAGISLTACSSCFSIVAIFCYFTALKLGTVAVVVTITALYPVIVLLLARIFLGEKMNIRQLSAVCMALVAVALLAG